MSLVRSMQSLGRNSLWLFMARITAHGLAILFIAIIARRIGVESFGQFTFIGAVVLIGNTFTNFGTDTYIIREVGRTRKTIPLISNAFGLQLALSALYWIAILILRPSQPLLLYSLSLFPLALFSVAVAALRGFERMDLVWTLSLANGLLQVVAALFSHDLWTLCIFLLLTQLLIAAFSYWLCSASLPNFQLFPFDGVYDLLKVTLPIAVLTLLLVLPQRLGVLTVSAMLGDAATGIFSTVTRIVDGLKLGHYAILGALLPIIARRTLESKHTFRIGFMLLIALSLSLAIGLSFFARMIILFLFGINYLSAIPLLSLFGWSLVPYTITSFISYELFAHEQESTLIKATAASLAVFLVLYFWLTSAYNLTGAIYAALAGETVQAILLIFFRNLLAYKHHVVPEISQ